MFSQINNGFAACKPAGLVPSKNARTQENSTACKPPTKDYVVALTPVTTTAVPTISTVPIQSPPSTVLSTTVPNNVPMTKLTHDSEVFTLDEGRVSSRWLVILIYY